MKNVDYKFPIHEMMEQVNWNLVVKLLVELKKGDQSFYKPYLDFLPICPSVWCLSKDELEQAAEAEPVTDIISPRRRMSLLRSVYKTVHSLAWKV